MAIVAELFYRMGVQGQAQVDRSLRQTQSSFQSADKSAQGLSNALKAAQAVIASGVLVRGFTLLARTAAESESAANRLSIVFRDSLPRATQEVENLRRAFGFSTTEAQQLVGGIGDILTGLGASQEEAAELSALTAQVAGSLRDFAGVDLAQASNAVTQALTGQTRQLQTLGIVIRQENLKQLAEDQGLVFESLTQVERAQLTVNEIMRQAGNAFAGASVGAASLAGTQARLTSSIDELLSTTAEGFTPFFTSLFQGLTDVLNTLNELPGPIKSIGTALALVIPVAVALNAALGPIGLVIGGIALAVTGITAAIGNLNRARTTEVQSELQALRIEAELTDQQFRQLGRQTDRLAQALGRELGTEGLEAITDTVRDMAEEFGLSQSEVVRIISASDRLSESARENLRIVSEQVSEQERLASLVESQTDDIRQIRDLQRETTRLAQEEAAARASSAAAFAAAFREADMSIGAINTSTQQAIGFARQLFSDRLEQEQEVLRLLEEQRQAVIEVSRETGIANTGNLERLREQIAAQQELVESLRETTEEVEESTPAYSAITGEIVSWAEAIENVRLDRIRAEFEAFREELRDFSTVAGTVTGAIEDIADSAFEVAEARLEQIEADTQAVISRIEDRRDASISAIERLEESGAISAEEAQARRTAAEAEADTQIEASRRELARREYEIELAQFTAEKLLSVARIAINTPTAVVNALAQGGIPLAVIVGIAAAAQLALALAVPPPPPPALQEGGIVNPTPGGRTAIIGEGGSREAVIPLDSRGIDILSRALDRAIDRRGGIAGTASVQTIQILLDGEVIANIVNDKISRGVIRIPLRS